MEPETAETPPETKPLANGAVTGAIPKTRTTSMLEEERRQSGSKGEDKERRSASDTVTRAHALAGRQNGRESQIKAKREEKAFYVGVVFSYLSVMFWFSNGFFDIRD